MNRIVTGKPAFFKIVLIGVVAILFMALLSSASKQNASASAFGATPVHTNAPGEANCTSCHSDFELNSGSGEVTISGVGPTYTPGQQMTVTVTATQADAVIYGFQLTAIDAAGNKAGTFDIPPQSEERIQILQGVVGASTIRDYVGHTSGGLSNGQFGFNDWVFTWKAPIMNAGRVTFYATTNAANSDGGPGGDYIYSTSRSTIPAESAVSITGRVTSPGGQPIRNARVVLTDSAGAQTVATTSSFGVYTFSNVLGGAAYTAGVLSKRYRFAPRTLTPNGNLSDIDFVGLE